MEIMATATNNHNQKELRLYAPNEQQHQHQLQLQQTTTSSASSPSSSTLATTTTATTGARSPFQREVREWQRIDPDTGALLTGRLEADRWINGPLNKYGMISDSQNIAQPNGIQQTQRKQLEVLQTCTPAGGAMQVIRSQKVQTTSSRWSTSSASATASPLLMSASTSPIPPPITATTTIPNPIQNNNNKKSNNNLKQKTHNSSKITNTASTTKTTTTTSPFIAPTLLTNGFHHHHLPQLQQQHQPQFPHNLVNGNSSGSRSRTHNRNWPDITENLSTLDICDNDHDNEHDHDNDYIVQQHSSDDNDNDNDDDNDFDDDSLIDDHDDIEVTIEHNDHDSDVSDDHDHDHHHQYMVNKRNNLKNTSNDSFNKLHSFSKLANHNDHLTANATNTTTTTSTNNHHLHDNHLPHNLSRDSSSGSCSNNNQLFLLDTAPSLKLSNLMKSSSSISNSSNNSTTASRATTPPSNLQTTATTTSTTNPASSSMNTHKSMASKISLHAIVGNNNNNNSFNTTTATTTISATPSPTSTTTTRPSWQQPTIYRQNSQSNNTQSNHNQNYIQHQHQQQQQSHSHSNSHLMTTRVGDNNNCCTNNSSSSSDESRSYAINTKAADLRHLQHLQPQQHQLHLRQNDRLTPTHSPLYNNRVDLESFRHYNTTNNDDANNVALAAHDDDDGLRLSSRHLRRQQTPNEPTLTTSLQRSRSISTDDLSTEWDAHEGDSEEPSEWRRVSKLRRSFQSSTTKQTQQSLNSPTSPRRPLDLPTNSVSVSKIRAELENSRRLNTVMKNNHVDLAALSSILNGGDKEPKSPQTPKRSAILTAESLKEIRGRLKKLSDESLYKEDFIINQQHPETIPEVEHIVSDQTKIKRTFNKSPERYRVSATKPVQTVNKHTTNSLESRVKYKDINSTDWHLRRKSYGFEKMSPPEKAMLRMDASTDSGLGRSGELQNWSPTSDTNPNNRTVVHFGETNNKVSPSSVQRRYRPQKSYEESEQSAEDDSAVSKRHSIAVDESQYVRDNSRQTTQIHLNGFYEPGNYSKLIHSTESTTTTDFLNRGQQKRVEFSKTEVHFATESGRVNIVETDSKPPPTNNFRRRKSRSSSVGPLQSLVKSATTVSTTSSVTSSVTGANSTSSATNSITSSVAMPITLFGDDNSRKKTLASTTVAYRAPLVGSPEPKDSAINVTVTIPQHAESFGYNESSRSSYASTSGVDTTDCDTDEMTSLRGILKNKPTKPKPYVLGENIDKPDDLWGVQLKPIQMKTENGTRDSSPLLSSVAPKSVAERIQELGTASASQSNGFSTKINVSLGGSANSSKNWEETGLHVTSTNRRPSVQELLMQDLKEHQKILDDGLKSTTLIIKTMRSASEFDEAMRRLSIASIEAAAVQPTPMLRSNSYQESTQSYEFMDGDTLDKNNLYKSTSFSSTSSWSTMSSSRKYSTDSRKTSTDSGASFPRKDSMPRLSFLGNEQIPVSQQLQRLRLIYDAATISQDEDSADEEVKSYFKGQVDSDSGGGTQESSSYEDDHYLDHTSSWSRLKAKKTIWKIDTDIGDGERSLKKPLDKTDLPKSNVMSIKLHSPQVTTEVPAPVKAVPPVAKPRTITSIQETQPPKIHTATTVKQTAFQTSLPTKDSLKIIKEARGARQLRTHELSYFGLPVSTSEDEKPKSKYTTNSNFRNSPKRSLPMRKLSEESFKSLNEENRTQWQLDNDKPDLLKHNTIVNEMENKHNFREVKAAERTSLKKKAELDEEDEHLYENIANEIMPVFKVKAPSPTHEQYDRKMDLKRDAMILSEMNKNADQTLRDISDEAALKDRRRRSLQRRNSKPLETIDEKTITERINDTCIAVKVSRGTYSSEAKKNSRQSTPSPTGIKPRERTSSQSSVECCPRARSRSLSSEKEYENIKSKPSRSSQMVKHKSQSKPSESRSSSLDSQRSAHSQNSSGDEHHQQQQRAGGSFRREDRSRTKTKRITNSATTSSQRDKRRDDKSSRQYSSHQHGDSKRVSSTTHSSTHRERVECKHDNVSGSTGQHRQHNQPTSTSGLQRSTAATASGRRYKDDVRDSQRIKRSTTTTASGRSTGERYDAREHSTSKNVSRSARDDERNSSQRSSSYRLERGDKDKERTSKSTKDLLLLGLLIMGATQPTNLHKRFSSSKNAQHHNHHQHQSKDRHDRHHRSKRDDESTEHVHGLKSAIIKTTTKLRDKSRSKKDKK